MANSKAVVPGYPSEPVLGEVTVTLATGRTAKMKELTGRQSLLAEACVPAESLASQNILFSYRAVASLVEFDGVPASVIAGRAGFEVWFDRLSGRELAELANRYYESFYLKIEESLPNESSASPA